MGKRGVAQRQSIVGQRSDKRDSSNLSAPSLPKYWRPATKPYTIRMNEIAHRYMKEQAEKHNVSDTFWLNTLLTRMAVEKKDFDPTPFRPTEDERVAVAVSQLTKEEHERAKVTRYGAVSRPQQRRRKRTQTDF